MAVVCAVSALGQRADHAIRNVRREQRTLRRIDMRNRSACPMPRRVLSKRMSEHKVTLTWQRGDKPFDYQKYSRDHTWKFDGGHEMLASAAPEYLGNPKLVDPEQAFVASLSSCHMLTFLAIAAKKKFVLDEYIDDAVGQKKKNAEGRLAITRATLNQR